MSPDPSARVCPRCGEPAGDTRYCGTCGLDIFEQPELPTRVEWDAQQQQLVETESAPTPERLRDGGSAQGDSRPLRQKLVSIRIAILTGILLVIAVIGVIAIGGGGTSAQDLEAALGAAGPLTFSNLLEASDITCSEDGTRSEQTVYSCAWSSGDSIQYGRWLLRDDGELARVSDGGTRAEPPEDAEQASARVFTVIRERNEDAVPPDCVRITGINRYSCLIFDSLTGQPLMLDGEPFALIWQWHEDGTVATEAIDFSAAERPF